MLKGAWSKSAHVCLDFCKGHFDGVEIRTVGREVFNVGTHGVKSLAHPGTFVAGEIVADHEITGLQRRCQHFTDVFQEGSGIDGSVEEHRGIDAVLPERSDKGVGVPMSVRRVIDAPFGTEASPVKANHLCVHSGFIDEHELTAFPLLLQLLPPPPPLPHISTVLFLGVDRFFYSDSPTDAELVAKSCGAQTPSAQKHNAPAVAQASGPAPARAIR